MSKELEALARQKSNVLELRETKFIEYADDFALIEQALKRNEPMKPIFNNYNVAFCPKCHKVLWQIKRESNYCFDCGQRLDWSDSHD